MNRVLPILFNGEMVRAILDGSKTVTRRIVKFPVNRFTHEIPKAENIKVYKNTLRSEKVHFSEEPYYCFEIKPPYRPGDILYIRETWNKCGNGYRYRADWERDGIADITKWKPSIHMPKEAARIWLKVTDVRVERLQEISTLDCQHEGIDICRNGIFKRFSVLWDSTIKKSDIDKYGWKANPWVWVIEFERCEKPESEG